MKTIYPTAAESGTRLKTLNRRKKIAKEQKEASPFTAMAEVPKIYREVANKFNEIRTYLADAKLRIDGVLNLRTLCEQVTGGFVEEMLEAEKITPTEVESDDGFMLLVERICRERQLLTRMRMCADANRLIGESIAGLESKIVKMRSMNTALGNTENEVEVAETRVMRFEAMVENMRRRGETVSGLFDQTAKGIENQMAKIKKDFNRIYAK